MSVLIQINGENAGEALKELAALAGPLSGKQVAVEAPKVEKPPRAARTTAPKPEPEPASEKEQPRQEEPDLEETTVQDPEPDSEPETDSAPIPTIVGLREKASEVGKTLEGKKAVKALLDEFGFPNISSVPENKRAVFMARLEKLAKKGDAE